MRLLKSVFAGLFIFSSAVSAGGIPVYSAVENMQQIMTHIEVLNDAAVQLEKLGVMDQQLTTQIHSLMTQYEQLNQQIQNARRIYGDLAYLEDTDLRGIIRGVQYVADKMGLLDPTNPHYDEVAKETAWEKYGDPTIKASDQLSGDSASLGRLDGQGERLQAGYEDYLQYQKYSAAQNKLGAERQVKIGGYAEKIDGLGDNSSFEVQRLNAIQVNLLLQQQEEMITRIDDINAREEERDQKRRAEELEAYKGQLDTLYQRSQTVYRMGD